VQLWRLALVLDDMQHGPGNRQFVEKCERSKRREGAGEVKRSGKDTGFYFPAAALGIEEEEAVKEFDFAGRAYAAVKIFEIRTTAESHVLAIVDMLAVGQDVRSGAAAQKRTLLEETDAPARISQRDASCQSRQPAADHDHVFQECSLPRGGRNGPWP